MGEKTAMPLFRAPFVRHGKRAFSNRASLAAAIILAALCFFVIGRLGKAFFHHSTRTEAIDALNLAGSANWEGWDKLDKLFVFGETNSATGFDVDGTQPGLDNPLGNPEDSEGSGRPLTGPMGPIWIHWATMQYNNSLVKTFDFASGGATIDRDIVKPVFPTASTFGDQITQKFMAHYGLKDAKTAWSPTTSLFACFFGVMDVIISYHNLERVPVLQIIESYGKSLGQLYDLGARNFVLFTVPPVDRPYKSGKPGVLELREDIGKINKLIRKMRADFMKSHVDANVFLLDTHALFEAVIQQPSAFKPTSGITYTGGPCPAYDLGIGFEGQPDLQRYDAKCGVPVNKYLWHDFIHPTYPMQEVIAQVMVEHCMGQSRIGFCT
ncbi:MAG: hypothetical protein M1831_000303 [Alyxoria varia]|nr:MAG: hypothetical protein M1831_000303 [Alyxoria varia]